ncbi:MAG: xanthine phosphoribosyltransferase [Ruminococcus sp.]|nr:xanthine phosphoribosyltransferase [Oscillospiraceae bacterium]MBR2724168.1 xanthine phosphoribosyltransferase [Ruminococcus sp.]
MQLLKERIIKDGQLFPGNILKVDSFLNHQVDISLLNEIGLEFKRRFADCDINKILTIEASGIGIACIVAQYFDCPVVFAKKSKSINISNDFYQSDVMSYTHGNLNHVIVSKDFIGSGDKVLVIDDFLAHGCALRGLIDIIESSGAELKGCGIVIEKGFQSGGDDLRNRGIKVESLAIVESMNAENGEIVFR